VAAKGIALCVGLNGVDPTVYKKDTAGGPGLQHELFGAENDAKAMAGIAICQGFRKVTLLQTEMATCNAVRSALDEASRVLEPGDMLLLTFAGHGTRVVDGSGNALDSPPEPDGMDEAWCLYDGLLLDDDLRDALAPCLGRERVRVIVVCDSCYNGTFVEHFASSNGTRTRAPSNPRVVLRNLERPAGSNSAPGLEGLLDDLPRPRAAPGPGHFRARGTPMPKPPAARPLSVNAAAPASAVAIAPALCFSASQDMTTTKEKGRHGKFTAKLLEVWNDGKFAGDYAAFRDQIVKGLNNMNPSYYWLDERNTFEAERPFTPSPAEAPAGELAPQGTTPDNAPRPTAPEAP
jgi:metacaspase-1